jgi:translation elongation factor EF-G
MADPGRRGHVIAMDGRADARVITATVPLANLFGYDADLAGLTAGRGRWSMAFAHYAPVVVMTDPDPRFPGAAAARVA